MNSDDEFGADILDHDVQWSWRYELSPLELTMTCWRQAIKVMSEEFPLMVRNAIANVNAFIAALNEYCLYQRNLRTYEFMRNERVGM